jgi:hypothetical protein
VSGQTGPAGPSWRRWALAACVLAIVVTLAALALLTRRARPASGEATADSGAAPIPIPESDRLYMSGIDYTGYDGAEPIFRLQAGSLVHRKRKVGPWTLNPIKEVEMTGVRIEIFPDPEGRGRSRRPLSLEGILQGTLFSKNLGFVSRVRLLDLQVDDRRDNAAQDHLTAAEAVWRPGDRRLVIEGAFEFSDGEGIHRDTNGAFAFSEDGRLVRVR